jgi:hypothetical protein
VSITARKKFDQRTGIQMDTNNLQAQLPLVPAKRRPIPLDEQTLHAKPTFLSALRYVIQCGNFEYEKELYQTLGIDAGNWSRIMNGSASFPQDKEDDLQQLCGNDGLVRWRANRGGYRLEPLQDAKDKEIAEWKSRALEAEKRYELAVEIMQWIKT